MFNSKNEISLDGKGIMTGHLSDRTEVRVFYDSGHQRIICQKVFMTVPHTCIKYPTLS